MPSITSTTVDNSISTSLPFSFRKPSVLCFSHRSKYWYCVDRKHPVLQVYDVCTASMTSFLETTWFYGDKNVELHRIGQCLFQIYPITVQNTCLKSSKNMLTCLCGIKRKKHTQSERRITTTTHHKPTIIQTNSSTSRLFQLLKYKELFN